jgi:AhpD family alkylhydroperoxidase
MVPNMMRTMAQSPQVLEGYLGLSGALGHGLLSAQLQDQIALAVPEVNGCDYWLSTHSALGRAAGLSADQLEASRSGRASDPKADATLQFARAICRALRRRQRQRSRTRQTAGLSERRSSRSSRILRGTSSRTSSIELPKQRSISKSRGGRTCLRLDVDRPRRSEAESARDMQDRVRPACTVLKNLDGLRRGKDDQLHPSLIRFTLHVVHDR